jgi:hypothetical protein
MSLCEIVVAGTLKPDGTLELDQKPNLAPGRVTVVLRYESAPTLPQEDWWQYMLRTRRELEATNYPTMTEHEVQSHIEWLRGDDDRIEEVYRQLEEERRRQEQG